MYQGNIEHLADAIRQLHADKIARITGVDKAYVAINEWNDLTTIQCSFAGWSPSLHQKIIVRKWNFENRSTARDIGFEEAFENITEDLNEILALQEERSRDALGFGFEKPAAKTRIDHLEADILLGKLVRKPAKNLREMIVNGIARAHGGHVKNYDGKGIIHGEGVMVSEHCNEGKWRRIVSPTIPIKDRRGSRVGRINGPVLEIKIPNLPDTVLNSMPGRKIGEFIEIHPDLDKREIKKIQYERKSEKNTILRIRTDIEVDRIETVIQSQ